MRHFILLLALLFTAQAFGEETQEDYRRQEAEWKAMVREKYKDYKPPKPKEEEPVELTPLPPEEPDDAIDNNTSDLWLHHQAMVRRLQNGGGPDGIVQNNNPKCTGPNCKVTQSLDIPGLNPIWEHHQETLRSIPKCTGPNCKVPQNNNASGVSPIWEHHQKALARVRQGLLP